MLGGIVRIRSMNFFEYGFSHFDVFGSVFLLYRTLEDKYNGRERMIRDSLLVIVSLLFLLVLLESPSVFNIVSNWAFGAFWTRL